MTILVTGAASSFGRGVVRDLQEAGHAVITLGRSSQAPVPEVRHAVADVCDPDSLRRAMTSIPDVARVIHLAAAVPRTRADDRPDVMARTNVAGTINVVEALGEGLERFVYASTAEVYGVPDGAGHLIGEDQLPAPRSSYGASKLAGEHFVAALAGRYDFSWAALRFTVLYGVGDPIHRAIPRFIEAALRGEPPVVYGGAERRDYLHVRDAAHATALATTSDAVGVYNVGTGETVTVAQAARQLADLVSPGLGVELRPRRGAGHDVVLDVARITRDIGFAPVHRFPGEIEDQIEWHRQRM